MLASSPFGQINYRSRSIAEQTINYYSNLTFIPKLYSTQPTTLKYVVRINNGLDYPQHPINDFISKHPVTFQGCLGCSTTCHLFRNCPISRDPEVCK